MPHFPLLIGFHALLASAAVLLGPVNILRRRKGDRRHRTLGYIWVGSMLFVSISSFWIRTLNSGRLSWIHILSCVMLVSLACGVAAARLHDRRTHQGFMLGAYFGLIGAAIPAVVAPGRMIPRLESRGPLRFLAGVGIVVVLTVFLFLLSRGIVWLIGRIHSSHHATGSSAERGHGLRRFESGADRSQRSTVPAGRMQ